MNTGKWMVVSAAVLLTGSILIAADEPAGTGATPATQPAEEKGARHGRLTKPWSELSGLSDAQKEQIEKIHARVVAEEKEIHAKERTEIEAVLTDEQKAQLKTLETKPARHRKGEGEAATTTPGK